MESVLKVGRTVGDGVCRAAGALAWGTRRILASIPLLGISRVATAPPDTETSIANITVRHLTTRLRRPEVLAVGARHFAPFAHACDKRKKIESHLSIGFDASRASRFITKIAHDPVNVTFNMQNFYISVTWRHSYSFFVHLFLILGGFFFNLSGKTG